MADVNMVFVLPSEFWAPQPEELAIAQLDLGPRPIIFEKPKEKSYKHLKGLYLKGFINDKSINMMLVDTGAAVNLMPLWRNHTKLLGPGALIFVAKQL